MSNPIDPFTDSMNIQTIQTIDQLNLPIMQKHHLRILTHCLIILKSNTQANDFATGQENYLREWCNNQSQRFDDQQFSDLLYNQLISTAKKINDLSERLGKCIEDLEINDLLLIVQGNLKN